MMSWIEQRRRAARRRKLARAFLGLTGLFTLTIALGMTLPAEHSATVRGSFDHPPEAIWRMLTDFDGMPTWRSDVTLVERLPDANGRTTWREVGRGGDVIVELAESEPPIRMVTQQRREGRRALPERTFHLVATDQGTAVTVLERSEVGNPIERVLRRLGAGASPAARLLQDLQARLNVNRRRMADGG